MPFINVKLIDEVFSHPQKEQMATRLVDAMASIEGNTSRSVTWVVIEEITSGDRTLGAITPSTSDVKTLAVRGVAQPA